MNVRFAVARQQGVTDDVVDKIDDDYLQTDLPDRYKVALKLTDVLLRDPRDLTDGLRAELAEQFQPKEIVELTAIVALYFNFSKLIIAHGLEPEDMPTTVLPTPDYEPAAGPGAG